MNLWRPSSAKPASIPWAMAAFILPTLIYPTFLYGEEFPCKQAYAQIVYSKEVVTRKLKNHPYLRSLILDVMEDPQIPSGAKRIIKRGLEDYDAELLRLDKEFREEYFFPPRLRAAMLSRIYEGDYGFKIRPLTEKPPSLNTKHTHSLNESKKKYPFKHGFTVLVEDNPISTRNNDLVNFVHELAHIKFRKFFSVYIKKNHKKFPANLVRKAEDGMIEVDEQLFHYLSERYSFESGLKILQQTHDRYYGAWLDTYALSKDIPQKQANEIVAKDIFENYGFTHPTLEAAHKLSLREIFLKGLPPSE